MVVPPHLSLPPALVAGSLLVAVGLVRVCLGHLGLHLVEREFPAWAGLRPGSLGFFGAWGLAASLGSVLGSVSSWSRSWWCMLRTRATPICYPSFFPLRSARSGDGVLWRILDVGSCCGSCPRVLDSGGPMCSCLSGDGFAAGCRVGWSVAELFGRVCLHAVGCGFAPSGHSSHWEHAECSTHCGCPSFDWRPF